MSVQLSLGGALNLRTPLAIHQAGEPDVRLRARYETRPLERPFYYALGVSRRGRGVELSAELVHHKLHLVNVPPEVQGFSVSHGYNLLLLGAGRELARGVWVRGAAGVVIAHPESRVRGRALDEGDGAFGLGYHLAGPALSGGLEARVRLGRAYATLGGRVTAAYARVPVAGGTARVPNVALHATAGVGADVTR